MGERRRSGILKPVEKQLLLLLAVVELFLLKPARAVDKQSSYLEAWERRVSRKIFSSIKGSVIAAATVNK